MLSHACLTCCDEHARQDEMQNQLNSLKWMFNATLLHNHMKMLFIKCIVDTTWLLML